MRHRQFAGFYLGALRLGPLTDRWLPPCWPGASASHRTPPRRARRNHEALLVYDWRRATQEDRRRRGFTGLHGSALRHLSPRRRPGRPGPRRGSRRGPLSGPLLTVDGLMDASVAAPVLGARPRIWGPGRGSLLASRQPVLAVADRANSMAPIRVQLVKYVLHLLSGTGRPARGGGCDLRNRRGPGDGRPPRLWPPSCCPERNRGHRCHKDNGQRDVRCHQVLHNALPQFWTAVAAVLPCRLDRSARRIRRYRQRRRAASAWQMSVHRPGSPAADGPFPRAGVCPRARDSAY